MSTSTSGVRLTSFSHGAGCACKLGPAALAQVMRHVPAPLHPDLIVGVEHGDDALVWRRPDGRALVATCDFFAPIVDDARTWGRIAAANAASDVYAMGGTPLFALNLVSWPAELDLELLGEVLAGGAEMAAEGGWVVAGGHTVDAPEPHYGQAVIGEVDPDRIITNASGRAGDVLVLTKPIGTGLVSTALKRATAAEAAPGTELATYLDAAVASMTHLNADGARIAVSVGARCGTDITGFGLLGHLHKLALASGVRAVIDHERVPVLPGARELLAAGMVPGGTVRNLDWVTPSLDHGGFGPDVLHLLADPQTSGGLAFACPPDRVSDAISMATETGLRAAVIGELVEPDVTDMADGQAPTTLLVR
ncbi:MAG TPA: selenide, water dikinase SelD [Ilumatobacteraceae bacterium]